MRLKNVALGMLVCVMTLACRISMADTLTLEGTGGQTAGNAYVYPYYFNFDGSAQTTPMMCINYDDEITQGETWNVQQQQISTASSVELQEDAWLFSKTGTYGDEDVQLAVWYIMASDTATNGGWDSSVEMPLVNLAQSMAPTLTNAFLNQYTVLAPVLTNQTGWTDGTPQSFIVNSSAVTPEPSSWLLLGTGLCAFGTLVVRRRNWDGGASQF